MGGRVFSKIIWSAALLAAMGGPLYAQAAPPNHIHYESTPEAAKPSPTGALAPRLQNLGKHALPWVTCAPAAKPWINQGINLAYGFNHAEAGRAFAEAARLDANCAMAWWGQALVLGPNINAPMAEADEARALEFVHKAESLKPQASLRERAYIDALAKRYTGQAADRKAADAAFAGAMRALSKRYPADLDAATLFAEALMTLRPWDYWARDGSPYPGTGEIISALELVMQRNPKHPGALHMYIHAVESTKSPERAEQAADTLIKLMPGAGHMVHMPSHIYIRVGRYNDAADANELAVAADEDYITQCRAQGLYPMAYYPHNVHFLWWAASFEGRRRVSVTAALKTSSKIPLEQLRELPFLQGFHVTPQYALVQFGMWDEILKEPAPGVDSPFVHGVWHYARGRAFVGKGQLDAGEKELTELRKLVASEALRNMPASFSANTALSILRVAPECWPANWPPGAGTSTRPSAT